MGRVQDKVALITGGASGIGLAAAQLLAGEGAKIVLTDRDEAQSRSALEALAPRTTFHKLDVTREDEWIAVIDDVVHDFGRIDILLNSAGVSLLKDIESTTLDEWRAHVIVDKGIRHETSRSETDGHPYSHNRPRIAAHRGVY